MATAALSLSIYAGDKLVVGATPVPHAEILNFLKPILAKDGVELQVKVFNDFIQPNLQLAKKNIDANYYQYRPFLDEFNKERKTNLVAVVPVHIEPFGAYSTRVKALSDLKNGATIAIPNDPVNTGRSLVLLHEAGLIKLKDPSNTLASRRDIVANPKQFKFRELEGAMLARALKQVDLVFVFANYALEAGIDVNSALITEKGKDLYAEYLVARPDNINRPAIQKLAKALNLPEVREFILSRYKGTIAPAF
jgi:D-methionine transport system substrate-binding protein